MKWIKENDGQPTAEAVTNMKTGGIDRVFIAERNTYINGWWTVYDYDNCSLQAEMSEEMLEVFAAFYDVLKLN